MQRFLANYRARLPFHSQCPRCNESYKRRQDRCTLCGFRLLIAPIWLERIRKGVIAFHIYGSAFLACLLVTPWMLVWLPVQWFELISSKLSSIHPIVWAGIPSAGSVVAFLVLIPLLRAVVDRFDGRKPKKELSLDECLGRCPWCTSYFKRHSVYCHVCGLRTSPIQSSMIVAKREALRLAFIILCFLFPLAVMVWLFMTGLWRAAAVLTILVTIVALFGLWRIGSFIVETDELSLTLPADSK